MADADTTSERRRWRYAAAGVFCLAVVGIGAYLYSGSGQERAADAQDATIAKPAVAAAKPTPSADEPSQLPSSVTDRARELVGNARRLAASGNFAEAETALQMAEKAAAQKALNEIEQQEEIA